MGKREDTVSRIKKWFDNNNYSGLESLSLPQIGFLFSQRHAMLYFLDKGYPSEAARSKLLNGSIFFPYKGIVEGVPIGEEVKKIQPHQNIQPMFSSDIRKMSALLDWAGISKVIEPNYVCDKNISWKDCVSQDPESAFDLVKIRSTHPLNWDGFRASLTVELSAGDDDLVAEFRRFLRQYRKFVDIESLNPRQINGFTGDSDLLKKALEDRYLQVLDIYLWGKVNSVKIEIPTLEKTVFFGVSEKKDLRNVVKLAKSLLDIERLESLLCAADI